jgi:aminopeptidase-like protein
MKKEIEDYFDRLWPLNRSLTGNGNRETIKILSELIDLKITEVPSGTECFDWNVPPEWNVREAWIKDSKGNVIVDFSKNNLHLLGYSVPVKKKMSLSELTPNIFTLPDQPELIPYLTSYYQERWGFCMSHKQFLSLKEDEYEVFIDSTLDPKGSMTISDAILKGTSDREILFSTYICHPSLASNELSGPLVAAFIYRTLKKITNRHYTYRFVFIPETIGSICYLSKYGEHLKQKLDAGFVLTCIGDSGSYTYKRSRIGNSLADRSAEIVLKQSDEKYIIEDFFPGGSDERQYCSPGFNLPVGSLMRTRYTKFAEQHTSADNKDYISFGSMEKSILKYLDIIQVIENNFNYQNTLPYCEPQLGKRGLYSTLGSQKISSDFKIAMMWILNLSDGTNDLIAISERSKIPVKDLLPVLKVLIENGIIKK